MNDILSWKICNKLDSIDDKLGEILSREADEERMCQCDHSQARHYARTGVCAYGNCMCLEFKKL